MDRRPHPSNTPRFLLAAALAIALIAGLTAWLTGCGGDESTTTTAISETSTTDATGSTTSEPPAEDGVFPVTVTDDTGATVTVEARPERIVATAPANTETLFALGVGDRVVGVTTLDDYPPEVADIPKVGDFQPSAEAVIALEPDLVVGYSGNEEPLKPVMDAGTPVLILNPTSLEGIYANILLVGQAVGAPTAAEDLVTSIETEVEGISTTARETGESPKVFYALDNTLWTAGPGSFVDELLALAGATNAAAGGPEAYYQLTPEQLVATDPDIILLPKTVFAEPDTFVGDPRFADLRAVKQGRVVVFDDVIVTRPGPRIAEGLRVLAKAIHPDAF
ncbi:MAG: ABC transporter substrate-binding protein [Thermoleophilia bacterium]|nr:ABC transporter substrate-binding protein [Thermoleophilia bacterium]